MANSASSPGTVSVIAIASNTVTATVTVGTTPIEIAVTPDGKQVYVANLDSGTVSVIATATNTVVATVATGSFPQFVGIVPPPTMIPFLAFKARLEIDLDRNPKHDSFELNAEFTLKSIASIDPSTEPVTLSVGPFIPPGSLKKDRDGDKFKFEGKINGVRLEVAIKATGTLRYAFEAEAERANLAGIKNPVPVTLTIGNNSGTTSVKARFDDDRSAARDD